MGTSKRILVTNATGDAGSSVIRELALAGHDVMGADTVVLPLGLRSRYLGTVHPLPPLKDPRYDQSLLALVRALRPEVFLPLGTASVGMASRHLAELVALTAVLVPTRDSFMAAFDHAACAAECSRLRIPCPAVYAPNEAAELLEKSTGTVTLVVKPRTDVGQAQGVRYVRQPDELRQSLADCAARFGGAMVQEYIPGDASAMFTVLMLFDRGSRLLAAFTTRKLRHWPPTGGVTAMGVSTAEAGLVQSVLPFFQEWRWQGFAEVELKLDARDGLAKVIEINPRIPSYLRFPIACGLPLGRLAVAAALGETCVPLPFPAYAVGKRFLRLELYLRSVAAELANSRSKATTAWQAFADLKGTGAYLAHLLSDPAPPLGRVVLSARSR